jgi:YebC/PmpR family DNA-binding regulatory protein
MEILREEDDNMSGHSKWSTIKRKKGAIDAERSKVFQKLAKELYVAAKSGDPDPANNASLRMVIEKAKAENMPKSNIQSAIDKAKAKGNGEDFEAVRYEGYGPGGMALIIDCLTDNRNRTASFVRSSLTKRGGNLGTDGSVSYLFQRKGILILDKEYDEDKLMEDVLELDIEDFVSEEDGYVITTTPDKFLSVKDGLTALGYDNFSMSEVTMVPSNYVGLDEETMEKAMALIETLEDLDDVQNVYHNLEM